MLAIGTSEGRIKIIGDEGVEATLCTGAAVPSPTSQLTFLQNRGLVLRICEAGTLEAWSLDAATEAPAALRKPLHSLSLDDDVITWVSPVPRQPYLLLGTSSGCIHVVALTNEAGGGAAAASPVSGLHIMPYKIEPDALAAMGSVTFLAAHASGSEERLLTLHSLSGVAIWDLRSQQLVCLAGPDAPGTSDDVIAMGAVTAACWLTNPAPSQPSRGHFATGYERGDVLVWQLPGVAPGPPTLRAHVRVSPMAAGPATAVRGLQCVSGGGGVVQSLLVLGGQGEDYPEGIVMLRLNENTNLLRSRSPTRRTTDEYEEPPAASGPSSTGDIVKLPWFGAVKGYALVPPEGSLSGNQEPAAVLILMEAGELVAHSLQSRRPAHILPHFQSLPLITCAAALTIPQQPVQLEGGLQPLCMAALRAHAAQDASASQPAWRWMVRGGMGPPAPQPSDGLTSSLYVTGHHDGVLRLWDMRAATLQLLASAPSAAIQDAMINQTTLDSKPLTAVAVFWEDGLVAAGHSHGEVWLYQFGLEDQETYALQADVATSPSIEPTGDGTAGLLVIEPPGLQLKMRMAVHDVEVTCFGYLPSRHWLCAGDKSGGVTLVSTSDLVILWHCEGMMQQPVVSLRLAACDVPGHDQAAAAARVSAAGQQQQQQQQQRSRAGSRAGDDLDRQSSGGDGDNGGSPTAGDGGGDDSLLPCLFLVGADSTLAVLDARTCAVAGKRGVLSPPKACQSVLMEVLDGQGHPTWVGRDPRLLLAEATAKAKAERDAARSSRPGSSSGRRSPSVVTPTTDEADAARVKSPLGPFNTSLGGVPVYTLEQVKQTAAAATKEAPQAGDAAGSHDAGHATAGSPLRMAASEPVVFDAPHLRTSVDSVGSLPASLETTPRATAGGRLSAELSASHSPTGRSASRRHTGPAPAVAHTEGRAARRATDDSDRSITGHGYSAQHSLRSTRSTRRSTDGAAFEPGSPLQESDILEVDEEPRATDDADEDETVETVDEDDEEYEDDESGSLPTQESISDLLAAAVDTVEQQEAQRRAAVGKKKKSMGRQLLKKLVLGKQDTKSKLKTAQPEDNGAGIAAGAWTLDRSKSSTSHMSQDTDNGGSSPPKMHKRAIEKVKQMFQENDKPLGAGHGAYPVSAAINAPAKPPGPFSEPASSPTPLSPSLAPIALQQSEPSLGSAAAAAATAATARVSVEQPPPLALQLRNRSAGWVLLATRQFLQLSHVDALLTERRVASRKVEMSHPLVYAVTLLFDGAPAVLAVLQDKQDAFLQVFSLPALEPVAHVSLSRVVERRWAWDPRHSDKLQRVIACSPAGDLTLPTARAELFRLAVSESAQLPLQPRSLYDRDLAKAAHMALHATERASSGGSGGGGGGGAAGDEQRLPGDAASKAGAAFMSVLGKLRQKNDSLRGRESPSPSTVAYPSVAPPELSSVFAGLGPADMALTSPGAAEGQRYSRSNSRSNSPMASPAAASAENSHARLVSPKGPHKFANVVNQLRASKVLEAAAAGISPQPGKSARDELLAGASSVGGNDGRRRTADEIRHAYGRPAREPRSKPGLEVRSIMEENQQRLAERGEKLSQLQDKTGALEQSAMGFAAMARQIAEQERKKAAWWKLGA